MMADFASVLESFHFLHQQADGGIDAGMLLLCRFAGFLTQAPVLSRKDVPSQFKIPLAFMITLALMSNPSVQSSAAILKHSVITEFLILILVNLLFGMFVGFAMRLIFEAITMAGGFITMQIGLQMANMMDPSTKQNSAILGPVFTGITTLVFIYIGDFELLLKTIDKTLILVPLHALNFNFFSTISIYQWMEASASMIPIALLLSAPFYISTILMDIILGIVNKTAQQIPVFQLSSSIKPMLGLIIFFVIVPTLFPVIRHLMLTLIVRL